MTKNLILFDMDGTLTESRKPFEMALLPKIRALSEKAEIGIISGSDLSYIEEQLGYLMYKSEVRYKLHLLPCNGTKHYKPPEGPDETFAKVHEVNMKTTLGEEVFYSIMKILSLLQSDVSSLSIPLTGNFLQYRGSMINWCPIGRNADTEERKKFVYFDQKTEMRKDFLKRINNRFKLAGLSDKVVCTLGGDTSFDIYPTGWDKTYGLQHFEDRVCWFVGDRCNPTGNDYQIYQKLVDTGRAFSTSSPYETSIIINESIIPKLKHL